MLQNICDSLVEAAAQAIEEQDLTMAGKSTARHSGRAVLQGLQANSLHNASSALSQEEALSAIEPEDVEQIGALRKIQTVQAYMRQLTIILCASGLLTLSTGRWKVGGTLEAIATILGTSAFLLYKRVQKKTSDMFEELDAMKTEDKARKAMGLIGTWERQKHEAPTSFVGSFFHKVLGIQMRVQTALDKLFRKHPEFYEAMEANEDRRNEQRREARKNQERKLRPAEMYLQTTEPPVFDFAHADDWRTGSRSAVPAERLGQSVSREIYSLVPDDHEKEMEAQAPREPQPAGDVPIALDGTAPATLLSYPQWKRSMQQWLTQSKQEIRKGPPPPYPLHIQRTHEHYGPLRKRSVSA
jgi:hypothetical protein